MINIISPNICPQIKDTRVYIQDDILDEDLYEDLLLSFPFDEMQRKDIHNKVALNDYNKNSTEQFLLSNKSWKEFIDYFFSESFIDLLNMNFLSDKAHLFSQNNIHIGYEFSILRDGSKVVPHKDKYGKLFSFVFYFVPKEWSETNHYGGTQFYEPKNRLLNLKIFNDSASFDSMKLIEEIKPTYNRLMIFEPNNTSWHGVSPISTNDKFGRPAFIVTIHRKLTILESFYNFISRITSQIQKNIK